MTFFTALFWLLFAHALGDYVLQSEMMGKHKQGSAPKSYGPWWWGMTAHSIVNGGGVALVCIGFGLTQFQSVLVGTLETTLHFSLDRWKEREIKRFPHRVTETTALDQLGHLTSKLYYAGLILWIHQAG